MANVESNESRENCADGVETASFDLLKCSAVTEDSSFDISMWKSLEQIGEHEDPNGTRHSPMLGEDALAIDTSHPVDTSTPIHQRSSASLGNASSELQNTSHPVDTSTLPVHQTSSASLANASGEPQNSLEAIATSPVITNCISSSETRDEDIQTEDRTVCDCIEIPILGYETLDERDKFTVFKVEVRKSSKESWFIFRRYSDFDRLNRQVKKIFPDAHLSLPAKKWFGDNFEAAFLDDRMAQLQIFINNILLSKDISASAPVQQFFCFDEPPGPYESLEESRALCESLEDQVYRFKSLLMEKDKTIQLLEAELKLCREKIIDLENQPGRGVPPRELLVETYTNGSLSTQADDSLSAQAGSSFST